MSLKRRLEDQYQQFSFAVRTITLPVWFNHSLVKAGLASATILFGVLYLLQTSVTATSGYEIRNLEKQTDVLTDEIQKVEIAVAEQSAMPNIQKRLSSVNMVVVENIKFVAPVSGAVALR
jgi:hypothetical protein